MKTFNLSVLKRTDTGKSATKRLRKEDQVPCVMYGGDQIYHFHAHENNFLKLVYTPEVFLVLIDIEGEKHKAIIQDLQFHPVTDKINHIDFVEVFDDKPVVTHIPIELTGSCIGLKNGGKLRQKRRNLKVKGLAKVLPDTLSIDMTNVDVGHVVKVGDLTYPNLELLDPHRSMVISVVSSRLAMKGMTIEEPVAGEEGEAGAEEAAEEESEN